MLSCLLVYVVRFWSLARFCSWSGGYFFLLVCSSCCFRSACQLRWSFGRVVGCSSPVQPPPPPSLAQGSLMMLSLNIPLFESYLPHYLVSLQLMLPGSICVVLITSLRYRKEFQTALNAFPTNFSPLDFFQCYHSHPKISRTCNIVLLLCPTLRKRKLD